MLPINRNITRAVLDTTDITLYSAAPGADAVAFVIGAANALYVGFHGKFATRYFKLSTLNTNAVTLALTYWNGSTWASVQGLIDQTLGFRRNGFISWVNQTDWTKKEIDGVADEELYWIKIVPSGSLSAGTELQFIGNLFCEDTLLRAYYPALINDTRYLPTGRSDFLEQYVAAKDLVVTRLLQDKVIEEESQIIDINKVALAATHAAAFIILDPIDQSEEGRTRADSAFKAYNRELNKISVDADTDRSGTVDEMEKNVGNEFIARG